MRLYIRSSLSLSSPLPSSPRQFEGLIKYDGGGSRCLYSFLLPLAMLSSFCVSFWLSYTHRVGCSGAADEKGVNNNEINVGQNEGGNGGGGNDGGGEGDRKS